MPSHGLADRQIEVRDVVPDDDIGIDLLDEVTPLQEKLSLVLEGDDLRANDMGARIESEDIADKRFAFACAT